MDIKTGLLLEKQNLIENKIKANDRIVEILLKDAKDRTKDDIKFIGNDIARFVFYKYNSMERGNIEHMVNCAEAEILSIKWRNYTIVSYYKISSKRAEDLKEKIQEKMEIIPVEDVSIHSGILENQLSNNEEIIYEKTRIDLDKCISQLDPEAVKRGKIILKNDKDRIKEERDLLKKDIARYVRDTYNSMEQSDIEHMINCLAKYMLTFNGKEYIIASYHKRRSQRSETLREEIQGNIEIVPVEDVSIYSDALEFQFEDVSIYSAALEFQFSNNKQIVDEATRIDCQDCIAQLDPMAQKIVRYYYFKGLSDERIGAIVGLHQSNVTRRRTEALPKLRKCLKIEF